MYKTLLFKGIIVGLILSHFTIKPIEQESPAEQNYNPPSYVSKAKKLGYIYTAFWTSSIAHEFGHALSARYFYKAPIDVTMGSCNLDRKPLLDMKYLKISGASPIHGFNKIIFGNSRWRNTAILASGPAAGMLHHRLFVLLL